MHFIIAILMSALLAFQPEESLAQSCYNANWWGTLDKAGWAVCDNANYRQPYLRGFWRSDPSGENGHWLLEEGRCCGAVLGSYVDQPATCLDQNWVSVLDGKNVWAVCPTGYYLSGINTSGEKHLYQIEHAKCCRPQNHPDAYEDCYNENVWGSFDKKGWSECKRPGYYMTGFYKSNCEKLYCIEEFKCCKMKNPSNAPTCYNANWWGTLDKAGWAVCDKANYRQPYLRGFWRSDPSGENGHWLLEEGRCCGADLGSYVDQPATCLDQNWVSVLDGKNVWALCPSGYYLSGINTSGEKHLYQIEHAKCCRPQNHPNAYEDCYNENVWGSFDKKGWSECKRDGYYMTGFYKSNCEKLYCIEEFRCCKMKSAAVNGGWSAFGAWGECSSSCGAGVKERRRTCTNPPPAYGGAQCTGPNKDTQECNNGPCPINGGWSDFGDWSECSVSCGSGVQERSRSCTNPPPAHGGKECTGNSKETRECAAGTCKVDGGFTEWSEFSECSKSCGRGKKTRTRECTNPKPSGGGKYCQGKYAETKKCKIRSCKGLK